MAAGVITRNRATMEKSSLFVEVESLCGATGYPLRTPRLEDTMLDAHTREPITVITERYLVRRVRSRSVAESVCGLDVNQILSQPTKYIPLTVHKAPELTKLQAASYVGVRFIWPLELARETELRWNNHLFLLKLKACAWQRVTLFERLIWKTPCLMHTLANQLRLSHNYTWAFYASVDGLSLGTIKSWHI